MDLIYLLQKAPIKKKHHCKKKEADEIEETEEKKEVESEEPTQTNLIDPSLLQSIIDEIKSRRDYQQMLEEEQKEEIVESTPDEVLEPEEEVVVDSFEFSENIDDEEEYDDDLEQEDVEVTIDAADVPLNSIIKEIEEKLATLDEDETDSDEIVEESYELFETDTLSSSFILDNTCVILPETEEIKPVDIPKKTIIKEPIFFNLPNETYNREFAPKKEPIKASFLDTKDIIKKNEECKVAAVDLNVEETQENPSFTTIDSPKEVQLDEDTIDIIEEKVEDEEMPLLAIENQPLPDTSVSQKEIDDKLTLVDNPYFGSRKMNFKLKPFIFSMIILGVVICLFVAIFVLIMSFR